MSLHDFGNGSLKFSGAIVVCYLKIVIQLSFAMDFVVYGSVDESLLVLAVFSKRGESGCHMA